MKSLTELTNYYYSSLFEKLKTLELERKNTLHRLGVLGVIAASLGVFIFAYFESFFLQSIQPIAVMLFVLFGLWFLFFAYYKKKFVTQFKEEILTPLVSFMGLAYEPKKYISELEYDSSKLFSHADRFGGSDHICGTVETTFIEFSNIHAEKKHKNSKGHTEWQTIFQGIFAVTKFNKQLHRTTVILPDSAEKTFGTYLGSLLQASNLSRTKLIKMDNVAFEKEFVVYGDDAIEAHYILTPLLMEQILAMQKRVARPLCLSFTPKKLYIAVSFEGDAYEPKLTHSLLAHDTTMHYVKALSTIANIPINLKLSQNLNHPIS